jgi:lipoate-protein ligase B
LGLVEYTQAFQFQQDILEQRTKDSCPDALIICEHLPVFTLGRLGKPENLFAEKEDLESLGLKVISVNRGGDITFHGPGQLVVYPVFDLKRHKQDLKYFLNNLEQAIIEFLKYFDCLSLRKNGFTGVWVGSEKIASIGICVKRWVSFHGLAVNINTDLSYFSLIKPCGLNCRMTSLQEIKKSKISMNLAKKIMVDKFQKVFGLELVSC